MKIMALALLLALSACDRGTVYDPDANGTVNENDKADECPRADGTPCK